MLILALDTSTPSIGAAIWDGADVIGEAQEFGAARHGELLAPVVDSALTSAGVAPRDLTALAVGAGPGPFTGLRVGLVFAAVMAATLDIPVYGVCSLDVVARAAAARPAPPAEEFLVALDARRREIYWGRYRADGERLSGPTVERPADLVNALLAGPPIPIIGAGALLHPELRVRGFDPAEWPEYPDMAVLAQMVAAQITAGSPAEPLRPLYLRRPDAQPNVNRKPVLRG